MKEKTTALEKLTNIIKEGNPNAKKDLEELRIGTKIILDCTNLKWCKPEKAECKFLFMKTLGLVRTYVLFEDYTFPLKEWSVRWVVDYTDWWSFEIIWNPLQEKHLRMYCEENLIHMCILGNGYICKILSNSSIVNTLIKLDNTKDLYQQSEKTLWEIVEFLINNK